MNGMIRESSVPNLYSLLGTSIYAGPEEIRRAFRRLAHRYHPDKLSGGSSEDPSFRDILEAYRILSDPISRKKYNQTLHGYILPEEELSVEELMVKVSRFQYELKQSDPFRYDEDAILFHFQALLQSALRFQEMGDMEKTQGWEMAEKMMAGLEKLPGKELENAGKNLLQLANENHALRKKIAQQMRWIPVRHNQPLTLGIALLLTVLLGWILLSLLPA